jgi:hypothetical protein
MKAIETNATLTDHGQLTLDEPLNFTYPSRVRVIVLVSEDEDPEDEEPEEDSIETIREGLYQGWQEALSGKTRPVAQLWDGVRSPMIKRISRLLRFERFSSVLKLAKSHNPD